MQTNNHFVFKYYKSYNITEQQVFSHYFDIYTLQFRTD